MTGLAIDVMRKTTLGLIGSHVLSALRCRSGLCPAPDKPARRAELIARAAPGLRLRSDRKVLRLGDHHRDVETAGGLAAGGDGRAVRGED